MNVGLMSVSFIACHGIGRLQPSLLPLPSIQVLPFATEDVSTSTAQGQKRKGEIRVGSQVYQTGPNGNSTSDASEILRIRQVWVNSAPSAPPLAVFGTRGQLKSAIHREQCSGRIGIMIRRAYNYLFIPPRLFESQVSMKSP